MDSPELRAFQDQLGRLDSLLRSIGRLADTPAGEQYRDAVQAILDLHGSGLARLLCLLQDAGGEGAKVLDACIRDEIVGGLLLLHGLHPQSLEERVHEALEQVRPFLRSHGGNVQLLRINDGVIRLRLEGSCHGCPSSAATMKQTIEEAILGRAPDAIGVQVEGVVEEPAVTPGGHALHVLQ